MASSVSGTTDVQKVAHVQENQNAPKVSKQSSNNSAANPQDTVTISSQARAAQQSSQTQHNGAHAEQGGGKK
ncbi:MAG TPA: hypothetical protein VIY69_01725 [Candidatus Acidoferrales bacterium]